MGLILSLLMIGRRRGQELSLIHISIYLFCGQLVFSYFTDATNSGMSSLMDNSTIFSKINVPKYMFLLSKNVSSFINFCLTLVVFLLFVAIDGIPFRWTFLLLLYPIGCLVVFNIGMGLILSALYMVCLLYTSRGYLCLEAQYKTIRKRATICCLLYTSRCV